MTATMFDLQFHAVGTAPDRALEDREFVIYNQCDGFHIVQAIFDDSGAFDCFYTFAGSEWPEATYRAWAVMPDCNDDLFPIFATEEAKA